MKKQGLVCHELEYLLRDYYSEATRMIKKMMEYWINLHGVEFSVISVTKIKKLTQFIQKQCMLLWG